MPRALISVSDKRGVVGFAQGLVELGWELVSTGGTAAALMKAGLPVTPVEDVTGFPEILDGRVKTLHPRIHAGLLARQDEPTHVASLAAHGILPLHLVAVNLYPFQATVATPGVSDEDAIENIDVGGPSMLRAAAKNYDAVLPVVDPKDYDRVLEMLRSGSVDRESRRALAAKVFGHVADYDAAIATYLTPPEHMPARINLSLERVMPLRYGENIRYTITDKRDARAQLLVFIRDKEISTATFGEVADLIRRSAISDFYNQTASRWNRGATRFYRTDRYKSIVTNEANSIANPVIADLGSAGGALSKHLAGARKIFCVDMAEAMLREIPADNVQPVIGDVTDSNLDDECADLVIAARVTEYVYEPALLLNEIKRIAKKGARIIATFTALADSASRKYFQHMQTMGAFIKPLLDDVGNMQGQTHRLRQSAVSFLGKRRWFSDLAWYRCKSTTWFSLSY